MKKNRVSNLVRTAICVLVFSVVLSSCSEPEKNAHELLNSGQEKAQKQFDQFYKCYEIAKNKSLVTENSIKWEAEDMRTDYPNSNVYMISFQSFKDLSEPLNLMFDGMRRKNHADMAKLFNLDLSGHVEKHDYGTVSNYSYHDVESGESCYNAVNHFLGAKYLVISRVNKVVKPFPIDTEFYSPGSVTGDALVFDVMKAELIGGYVIDVTSTGQISVPENQSHKIYDNLEAKLEMGVQEDIFRDLMKLAPFVTKEKTGSFF